MGKSGVISGFRQHAGQDFQAEIFGITETRGTALEHTDLVVQPSPKPSETLFSGWQYAADPIPVPLDREKTPKTKSTDVVKRSGGFSG